ncbi:MAG: peptide chain release factor N(5)-glutamine methyltransferase [Gammaproteobacteria bacterium]|nr:peptide chain release factor N(5)-glutamine methyltransferase [Gammaproteobacteria bacterium]
MPTRGELVRWGGGQLGASDTPRLDAELLLMAVLGLDRSALFRDADRLVAAADDARYRGLVAARAEGRPVAQLLGVREFWSLEFEVDEHCLVPRPETELLVERALAAIPSGAAVRIADLGTGSGAIAVAIARERPQSRVVAVDVSPAALAVAARNAARLAPGRVALVRGDWLAAFAPGSFEVIVSNPPYVAADDPLLTTTEIRFEPRAALAAGPDGLSDLGALARQAAAALVAGGRVFLEHGTTQGPAVRALLTAARFADIATARDLAGHERVTSGRRP